MVTLLLWPFDGLGAQDRVEMRQVPSRDLGVEKAIAVYLPASYSRSSLRYPVAYYLHGGGGKQCTVGSIASHWTLSPTRCSGTGAPDAILADAGWCREGLARLLDRIAR